MTLGKNISQTHFIGHDLYPFIRKDLDIEIISDITILISASVRREMIPFYFLVS